MLYIFARVSHSTGAINDNIQRRKELLWASEAALKCNILKEDHTCDLAGAGRSQQSNECYKKKGSLWAPSESASLTVRLLKSRWEELELVRTWIRSSELVTIIIIYGPPGLASQAACGGWLLGPSGEKDYGTPLLG